MNKHQTKDKSESMNIKSEIISNQTGQDLSHGKVPVVQEWTDSQQLKQISLII